MKKLTKAMVAASTIATLSLGTLAVNATDAHAETTPSATQAKFVLEGNAGDDASFLTSPQFIEGLNGGRHDVQWLLYDNAHEYAGLPPTQST